MSDYNGINIVRFPGVTHLDLYPDNILRDAIGNMEGVVLLGYDKSGEYYFAASYADGGETLWLLEMCKKRLLEIGSDE